MSDISSITRQLKIKTGVVKRLFKEEQSYRDEAKQARVRLQKMRDSNAEGADIRNAERVVNDSEQMVPITRKSLADAVVILQDLVDALAAEESIASTQEYKDAAAQLEVVEKAAQSA